MDCKIFELMKWYDWTALAIYLLLAFWKMVDLCRLGETWVERKIERDRAKRDAALNEAFEKYQKSMEQK